MSQRSLSVWMIRGLYIFAVALVVTPLLDLASTAWPIRLGDLSWRYGFLGLLAGYLHTPTLGIVLAFSAAHLADHVRVAKSLGTLMLCVGTLLLIVMPVFMLDVIDVRGMRDVELRSAVLYGGLLQEAKYGLGALALMAMGWGARKTVARRRST